MIFPQIQFKQYDGLYNPSGTRNIDVTASGWVKEINTSASGVLDFGFMDITTSGCISPTKLLLFRPSTLGSASQIYNFKLYISSATAWTTGTYRFLYRTSIPFVSGLVVDLSDSNIPTSVPSTGNILSTASGSYIQSTVESGCSQYIYLAVYANNDVPTGQKGGPAAGSFRYRLQYDFI